MTDYNNLPIKHFSYSMMQLWGQCRECFKYKYVMGLEGEIPDYFEDGRKYHDEVHKYHVGEQYDAELIKPYTNVIAPEFRTKSEQWVEDLNGGKPLYLGNLPLPVKGKLDGINDECINDLKYMKGRISQRQADESLQATLYIWVMQQLTDKFYPFWYVTVDKVTNKVGITKTTRGPHAIAATHDKIMQFFDEVASGDFEPVPGHRCYGQCEYYSICTNCGGNHGH